MMPWEIILGLSQYMKERDKPDEKPKADTG